MSQSNNSNFFDNLIIITLIFIIISVGSTVFLIVKNKANENIEISEVVCEDTSSSDKNEEEKIVSDGLGIKSLDETYRENNLKIERIQFNDDELVSDYYYQISGLKNKEIENKINEELKNAIPENARGIYCKCYSNFGNTLSIMYWYIPGENAEDDYTATEKYFNYDLSTGEQIKFRDLFTNDAQMKNILSKCVYDSLACDYSNGDFAELDENVVYNGVDEYELPEEEQKEAKEKMQTLEDETFKVVRDFNNGKDFDFYYSPSRIFMYVDGTQITIPIYKYYNQIAIYNRYSNSDIYDGTANVSQDDIYVCLPSKDSTLDINSGGDGYGFDYFEVTKKNNKSLIGIRIDMDSISESKCTTDMRTKMMNIVNNKINEYLASKDDDTKEFIDVSLYYSCYGDIENELRRF